MSLCDICITKDVLSIDKNLICELDYNSYSFAEEVPKDSWVISYETLRNRDVMELATINGFEFSNLPPQKYENIFKELGETNWSRLNIKHSMTNDDYKMWIKTLINDARKIINDSNKEYYENVFLKMKNAILSLSDAKINRSLYYDFLRNEEKTTQYSILKTFLPDDDGYSSIPEYSLVSSITGRLSVKSGPQILVLKKEYRKMIESRFGDNGKIIMLDYISLEPRIASIVAGKNPGMDVYADISNNLFDGKLPRKITKLFVLPLLYGMSSRNLKNKLKKFKTHWDVERIIEKIYDYFSIKKITEGLVLSLHERGFIESRLGRPVFAEKSISAYLLLNYLVQSSAVETALLGFNAIIDFIKNNKLGMHPLFIIHDALVLDVHKKYLDRVEELKEVGSQIKEIKDFKFYLKEEEL